MTLAARCEVRLFDYANGAQVAMFDTWKSLQYQNKLNDVGFFVFTMDAEDDRVSLFDEGGTIEVWRWIPGVLDPYQEFAGVIENFDYNLFANGNFQFQVVGSSLNGILAYRRIAYTEDTTFSKKSAAAETCMKEYVDENCTTNADATREEGTQAQAEIPGLTIQADSAQGPTWAGERSGQGVLGVCREIAVFAEQQDDALDFQLVATRTSNSGPLTCEFRTYPGQLGKDRTATGIDPATGLNASGNAPHVFSTERDNVQTMRYALKNRKAATAVYIWGTGRGAVRTFGYSEDAAKVGLLRRESVRGGSNQTTDAERDTVADEWRETLQPDEVFTFAPKDVEASLYGVHYKFGDKVTAQLGNIVRNKKITAVTITVGGDGETKHVEFTDISR